MVDEISLYIPDRPGELSKILNVIKDANVNILGLTIDEVQSVSIARFIVDAPGVVRDALEEKRYTTSTCKVFTVQLPHQIGALNRLVALFARHKINVRYIYLMQLHGSPDPIIIVRTDPKQEKEAKEVLQENSFRHIRLRDLVL
jgi:hypothetical protein